jgi:urate oxidase
VARLTDNSYGKSRVRLTKVVRAGEMHSLLELTVQIALGGGFERVYTHGDNSPCIPTDTMKNTVYALAKRTDFDSAEDFGRILATHFIESFGHVDWAEISIEQALWSRIQVDGTPHAHAFQREGSGTRTAFVREKRGGTPLIRGGLAGLEVMKTTRSGFDGFLKDQYTTLPETTDRILATIVDASWDYGIRPADYNALFETARQTILEAFATHDSRSVQQTLYAMGEILLARVPEIESVSFTMPNQHRILVNLQPFGLANQNEIFTATSEPYGLIKGTVTRE